ncbi:divergent polysaccharide deacetylase family protein [Cohnella herbarum]|uniref:Divergent polysaccharide deacetylase family protein n=1 Tax=Cohnella herbarum TaxID=2728023 RepID=A0A7Z2VFQ7_9BACL|nr:divergent polysaccharide deacetylase family protein [Cohnella herbarum]QJD82049.1 divergent polysaccharide deacetylase family protein [Cohnella herbarum]
MSNTTRIIPWKIALILCVGLLFGGLTAQAGNPNAASADKPVKRQIAVVIDDFGNGMKGTEQMLDLPIRLTVAVMPFLRTTKQDAEAAHRKGHDVIVHLPMEPVRGLRSWLGPGSITTDLPDEEIRKRVEAAIADVPHAIGMNNHMGSKATADSRVMRVVLQVCKEKGLFFLDSRTSYKTVVPKVAKEVDLVTLHNDVFLDDVYTQNHVLRQIAEVKKFLTKNERCIVIGHVGAPGLYTSSVLRNAIPDLKTRATFVPLTQLLPMPEAFDQGLKLK